MPSRTMLRRHSCHSLTNVDSPFLCNTNLCSFGILERIIGKLFRKGCLDSMERGTVEWNSGTVEQWNGGMVE